MCQWYGDHIEEVDILDKDWYPPNEPEKYVPLRVGLEIFTDMVLHCHYVTRT